MTPRMCKCGCGTPLRTKRSTWAPGHFSHDPEKNRLLRAKLKSTYSKSETREKLAGSLRAKWQSGTRKPTPASAREKAAESNRRTYQEGTRKPRDPAEWREACAKGGAARSRNQVAQVTRLGIAKKGVANIGRGAATVENWAAKGWEFRSPTGVPYRFVNLALWVRENVHLFRGSDDRPHSKRPLEERVAKGLGTLLALDGKSCSYKGWTAVSKLEIEAARADLLGRDGAEVA